MKDNFFLDIIKNVEPDYEAQDVVTTGFIDTGSYALNALISASIYGGIPNNRVTGLAGEQSTGKTYFALAGVRQFLIDNPTGGVFYFDSEFALEREMLTKRGIDASRVFILKPETLQDFRTTALKLVENYEQKKAAPPLLFVLDSLGNLPTIKEVNDAMSGSEAKDMTRQQIIRSIFRVLTLKLGKSRIPMWVTNHTYQTMDLYSPAQISGGGGLKYAASTIITMSRAKDKDDGAVVGNLVRVSSYKSRYSKENQQVQLKLHFEKGLDRYYGLLDLAEKHGIFKKVSTRFEMPDGSKHFGTQIERDPTRFFTKDILDRINIAAKKEYSLGSSGESESEEQVAEVLQD